MGSRTEITTKQEVIHNCSILGWMRTKHLTHASQIAKFLNDTESAHLIAKASNGHFFYRPNDIYYFDL